MKTLSHLPYRASRVIAITLAGLGFFCVTNPVRSSPLLAVLGTVILGVLIYVWSQVAVDTVGLFWPFQARARRLAILMVAGVSVFLIIMQSIGELSWRDVFAIVPLATISYIYLSYMVNRAEERKP